MLVRKHFLAFPNNLGLAKGVVPNPIEYYDDVDGLYFVFLSYPLLQAANVHHWVDSDLEYLFCLLIVYRQNVLHILPWSAVSSWRWRYVLRHFSFSGGHRVIVNGLHIFVQIISAVVTVHHLTEEFVGVLSLHRVVLILVLNARGDVVVLRPCRVLHLF